MLNLGIAFCEDPYTEIVACREEELVEGVVKSVQVGSERGNSIVVAKVRGKVYAVGGKCSHYGAPLQMGYLDGFSIICPWHLARFNVRTGESTVAPGIQSIPSYEVKLLDGNVIVRIPTEDIDKVTKFVDSKRLVKRDINNHEHYIIVGGGAAGQMASETLRKEGFTGKITLITKDNYLPYDRIVLSKNFDTDVSKILLRTQEFYDKYDIEVKLSSAVKQVDDKNKTIRLENEEEIPYDKVLFATGSTARVPAEYKDAMQSAFGIYTIRSASDHNKIKDEIPRANDVVIIGASFLGLEAATSIKKSYPSINVTVIGNDPNPLERVFGSEIAGQIVQSHRANGVNVIAGNTVKTINHDHGRVVSVTIPLQAKDEVKTVDAEIKADLVLIAAGGQIQTSYIPPQLLNSDGSVRVNSQLQTLNPDLYAAGDIASFPSLLSESRERLEHWQVAQQQGKIAAKNMLGKGISYSEAPFFWTNQFINAQFVGYGSGHDWTFSESKGEETPMKTSRITYFFKDSRCIGAAALN